MPVALTSLGAGVMASFRGGHRCWRCAATSGPWPAGAVAGALTVSIPIRRYTPKVRAQAIEAVIAAARDLSQQLAAE
jgi:DNA-binding IclR family transcriptional regulator